jgi:hypothetical protein
LDIEHWHSACIDSMSDRRQFLLSGSMALAAALASCAGPSNRLEVRHRQRPPPRARRLHSTPGLAVGPPVTPETFAEAAKLAQFEMTDAERRIAAGSWRTSMAPLLERRIGPRKVALDPTVAPATQWSPWQLDARASAEAANARDRFVRAAADPGALPSSDSDIAYAPVHQLSRWIETKKLTSQRLTTIYLDRIQRYDGKLRSVITTTRDAALAQAKQADSEIAAGKYRGPLHGIPYGVKDLLDTAGIPTTYGAEPFRNRIPSADSVVVGTTPSGRCGAAREIEHGRAGAQRHLVWRSDDEPVAARRGRRRDRVQVRVRRRRQRSSHSRSAVKRKAASSVPRCAAVSQGCVRRMGACREPER